MRRRQYITVTALAAAGLAGCSGGESSESTESTDTESMSTDTESMATATEAMATGSGSPKEFFRSFYGTLYSDNDIEAANGLYHPESPAPEIVAENFAPFGGLEAMSTTIEGLEVVSEGEQTAEVHGTVTYSTAAGSATDEDYLYLRKSEGNWRVNVWLPETPRERLAREKVQEFYNTLYSDNDIEGANELYHPESEAPEIVAEDFEPYGGLEAMSATVEDVSIVSMEDKEAELHATVNYSTPAGSSTDTDYLYLRLDRIQWWIDRWVPEAVRESGSTDSGSTDS